MFEEIRARAEAATPGPWTREEVKYPGEPVHLRFGNCDFVLGRAEFYRDADFITQARDDIPALIAEVERVTAELRAYGGMKPAGMKILQENCKELHEVCREHQQERMELEAQLELLSAYRTFAERVKRDYTECDKLFIHISA